jgi:hypothetical protein
MGPVEYKTVGSCAKPVYFHKVLNILFSESIYKELFVILNLDFMITDGECKFGDISVVVKLTLLCQILSLALQFFCALWVMKQNNEFLFNPVDCRSSSIKK